MERSLKMINNSSARLSVVKLWQFSEGLMNIFVGDIGSVTMVQTREPVPR